MTDFVTKFFPTIIIIIIILVIGQIKFENFMDNSLNDFFSHF